MISLLLTVGVQLLMSLVFWLIENRNRKLLWPNRRVSISSRLLSSDIEANKSHSAIGIPIANALLIDGLHSQVPKFAPEVASEDVVRNGALNLENLTRSPSMLRGLRQAYAIAISHVCILLVVVVCVSIPVALGMEWLNIKKVS